MSSPSPSGSSWRGGRGERPKLLDPRTFPLERLPTLVHALPPKGVPIEVADLPGGAEAAAWLSAHGRPARLVPAPPEPQPTRLWEPTLPLSKWLSSPLGEGRVGVSQEEKTALDLGCGTGRDAVYLALHGWRVTAVDLLPDALDRARALADLHEVTLDLRILDVDLPLSKWFVLERGPGGEDSSPLGGSAEGDDDRDFCQKSAGVASQGEGRVGVQASFDLVTAFRFLPDLAKAAAAVRPGGTLLVETFTDQERERTGKPKDPRLVLPAAAPPPLPEGLTLIDYRIREGAGRELATLTATRA